MNFEAALYSLHGILTGVLYHHLFPKELLDIVRESGVEQKIFKLLAIRLSVLNATGVDVTRAKEYEAIGQSLYSMHLTGKQFNIRILFAFLPNAQPVLLSAFYERGGKSKTDYSSYIEPALGRLSEMKGKYYNER